MRITTPIRVMLTIIAFIVLAGAGYLYRQVSQVEKAYVFTQEMEPYTQITSEDYLQETYIPVQRDFEAVTDLASVINKYTAQKVSPGQLVQTSVLMDELPSGYRFFENGPLPENRVAYPIPIDSALASVIRSDDMVDVFAHIDKDGEPSEDDITYLLFQKIQPLEVIGADGGTYTLVVALNAAQIPIYEGIKNLPYVWFSVAISQEVNGNYPPLFPFQTYPDLTREDIQNLFIVPTPAPVPAMGAAQPQEQQEEVNQ